MLHVSSSYKIIQNRDFKYLSSSKELEFSAETCCDKTVVTEQQWEKQNVKEIWDLICRSEFLYIHRAILWWKVAESVFSGIFFLLK